MTPSSAGAARTALLTILALTATTSVILATILAERFNTTIDLTRLGSHTLAPRTNAVLDTLDAPHEVILAGPWSADPRQSLGIDAAELRNALDVLRAMDRASPNLRVTLIDTTSASAQTQFRARIAELLERESAAVNESRVLIDRAAAGAADASRRTTDAARDLDAFAEQTPEQFGFPQGPIRVANLAETIRLANARLRALETDVPALMQGRIAGASAPEIDRAAALLRSTAENARGATDDIARILEQIADVQQLDADRRQTARLLAANFAATRDQIAKLLDDASAIEIPRVVLVARLLESSSIGAVVIGPQGVAGIDAQQLFPTAGSQTADTALARRAEEVITAGILACGAVPAPIIVFVHAEGRSLLESGIIANLQARFARAGADMREWDILRGAAQPTRIELDPTATRPIIWVSIGLDVGTRAQGVLGVERSRQLATALEDLIAQRENVMLNLAPFDASLFRSGQATDRVADLLAQFGLEAATDAPILTDDIDAEGRVWISPAASAAPPQSDDEESPAAALNTAVRNLPVGIRLASAISVANETPPAGVSRAPLLDVPQAPARQRTDWGLYYRAALAQLQQDAAEGNASDLDLWLDPRSSPSDVKQQGPWTVAYAIERESENAETHRIIAIGAHAWFFDSVTSETTITDGRETLVRPGNTQLFDSSIAWLAKQDDLIAAGPTTSTIPRIRELSANQRTALAWALIAGLPLTILTSGLVYRLIRG